MGKHKNTHMESDSEIFEKLKQQINQVDLSLNPNDEVLVKTQLETFKPFVFGFNKVVPCFERLTINKRLPKNNNETIRELKYLKNPPSECVNKYGRANLKQQSVLYATFILPTAIFEMKPLDGDLVTISKWRLKLDNTPLMVYPVIDYDNCKDYQLKNEFSKALKMYPKELQEIIIMDNQLLTCYFSRFVDREKDVNYIFSAYFADKILNDYYDGKIDAIIYPSVQDPTNSANIALKPQDFNDKYEVYEISESIVRSNGYDSLFLERIKTTTTVDLNGMIQWK
jgi:hypothetical protein